MREIKQVVAATPLLNRATTVRDSVSEDDDSGCEPLAMPSTPRPAEIAWIDETRRCL